VRARAECLTDRIEDVLLLFFRLGTLKVGAAVLNATLRERQERFA
jgi:hypothetical protein